MARLRTDIPADVRIERAPDAAAREPARLHGAWRQRAVYAAADRQGVGRWGVIWATALLTRDIYATVWANFLVGTLSILLVDMPPAKRLHGYPALSQVKDVLPILALSAVAAAAALAVQLLGLGYLSELLLQCAAFALVYLGGARLLRLGELSETASLVRRLVFR